MKDSSRKWEKGQELFHRHASKVEYNRVTEWSRGENGCGELAGERPDARVARVQGDCVFKIRSELI